MTSPDRRFENWKTPLGAAFDIAVTRLNGITLISPAENGHAIFKRDVDVTIIEPAHRPHIKSKSAILDKRALSIGDVLGNNVILPHGHEHLDGWIIYNVRDDAVPQALEPLASATDRMMSWENATRHIETLKEQGHQGARLWGKGDSLAVFWNIVQAEHNDKAQLSIPDGRYWEEEVSYSNGTAQARVTYPGDAYRMWKDQRSVAYVRAVQDLPALRGEFPCIG